MIFCRYHWWTHIARDQMKNRIVRSRYILLIGIALLLQIIAFKIHITKNVQNYYNIYGDQNWYLYFHYNFLEALRNLNFSLIANFFSASQWGGFYFLQSAGIQALLGPGRFGALAINFIYFAAAQLVIYFTIKKHFRSGFIGFTAWLLFMNMNSPFRNVGPAMNLTNYHMDLGFFFLILVSNCLVITSNGFSDRGRSFLIGLISGLPWPSD